MIGITAAQVATIEHEQLGKDMPTGLVADRIPWFPTPGRAIQALPYGSDKRRMLERLHSEYAFLCSFVHGLTDANLFKTMFNRQSHFRAAWTQDQLDETFYKAVAIRAYTTSLLIIIQAVSEITVLYPDDVPLRAAVTAA